VVDRTVQHYAQSATLALLLSYTEAAGVAGDLITVAGTIVHGDSLSAGAIVSPVTLQTFSVNIPWTTNGHVAGG
jgi:hypothetical protein